jgi:DNA-binding MarR family transcriptional regulator
MLDFFLLVQALSAGDWTALGLTMPQFKVIALLLTNDAMTVTGVAQRLGVTPPTASGIIDRLEEKHLVYREDDETDRRVVHVKLVGGRGPVLHQLFPATEQALQTAVVGLDPQQQTALERAMQAAANVLRGDHRELAQEAGR